MLCNFCHYIDFDLADSEYGAPHHANYHDLVASARNGCDLCLLVQEIGDAKDHQRFITTWAESPIMVKFDFKRDLVWGAHTGVEFEVSTPYGRSTILCVLV